MGTQVKYNTSKERIKTQNIGEIKWKVFWRKNQTENQY